MMKLCWIFLCVSLMSCVSGEFYRTSSKEYPPRKDKCEFEVLTLQSDKPFDEIGLVEFDSPVLDMDSFKSDMRYHVCKKGGDAVIAHMDGKGRYVRGTIIKFR